jgi:hypothetical protein
MLVTELWSSYTRRTAATLSNRERLPLFAQTFSIVAAFVYSERQKIVASGDGRIISPHGRGIHRGG